MRKVLYLFGVLDDSDIEWLQRAATCATFESGQVLIEAGEPVAELHIVLSGQLSVRSGTEPPTEVAVLEPGEVVGELSFLDSRPPNATVVALTRVRVLSIRRTTLRDRLERDAGFAARFYRALGIFLANRLRQTMGHFGFGDAVDSLDSDQESADELDPELLDQLAIAGRRFDLLLGRFS